MATTFKNTEENSIGRIYILVDEKEAGFIEYKVREDNSINAHETMVYEDFRGQGIAGLLFNELINFAKNKGIKIYPTCSYIVKSFEKNQDLNNLLAEDYQK